MKQDKYNFHYKDKTLTVYEDNEVLCVIPEVEVDEVPTVFVEAVWDLREVDMSNI